MNTVIPVDCTTYMAIEVSPYENSLVLRNALVQYLTVLEATFLSPPLGQRVERTLKDIHHFRFYNNLNHHDPIPLDRDSEAKLTAFENLSESAFESEPVADSRRTGKNLDRRRSFNIETGDIIRVRAGTLFYLINRDENEKLFIVKLCYPSIVQAIMRYFTVPVVQHRNRFMEHLALRSFNLLSRLQEISWRGGKGVGIWPFGSDSKNPFNIFKKRRPSKSNKYGQFFEVDADEFQHLKDFDLRVPMLTSPGIHDCPIVQLEGNKDSHCRARRSVLGNLVPAGHPFVTVAARHTDLEVLRFEVNIENNVRHLLAGECNFMQQFEKEAKELAFNTREEEVDRIFGNQDDEFFFPGPRQQEKETKDQASRRLPGDIFFQSEDTLFLSFLPLA
ncbi:hypothetical protein F3Y22_tig00110548pilonHSYRG00992 [Hibiscus syriacus]|uniref:Cupin type-1 domain-containing protein n=1 Tax=Hibiscus syriacus TaxID=106335 RepID=A0A6A3AE50_HIBSY|nr:hypothetical protein F3Y22_tig00110548pilonHSYRG00992 [Hibiscus syriacus]